MRARLLLAPLALLLASCATFRGGPNGSDLLNPDSPAMQQTAPESFAVEFETTKGSFTVEVTRTWAPLGVDRFFNLVRHGYYDGAYFFRVVPGFVVQFGIPADTALARIWPDQHIDDDPVTQENLPGTISFASAGPDTRTTQLFINLGDNRRLDGLGFAPFGRVTDGMDVVRSLYSGYGEAPLQDRIEAEGSTYIEAEFPFLDHIVAARLTSR